MRPIGRASLIRNKNRNNIISMDLDHDSRSHNIQSQPKNNDPKNSSHYIPIHVGLVKSPPSSLKEESRNPEYAFKYMPEGRNRTEDHEPKMKARSSFQKTATGFHKQPKEVLKDRFYETAINGFIITNNRPISNKHNRDRLPATKRDPEPRLLSHAEDFQDSDVQLGKNFRPNGETEREEIPKRPQTSKGLRKRGIQSEQEGEQYSEQLYNELIPAVDEDEHPRYSKKTEQSQLFPRSSALKRKPTYPQSAQSRRRPTRDLNDLITINPGNQRVSVSDFVVPFETSVPADFLCLFANGK